jgi:diaminohydroxyphosphoribosylaminopyrimidine deaminase/5-amino-6-(5-phosphoribosylamino)uracil reductase
MRRALELAASVAGTTNPNPHVGAVVLDADGVVVGEGATEPAGGAHAEIVALRAAGERAHGGTLVVTLEPCRHHGRTGPCTTAIAGAGIRRVVMATGDPSPEAGGGAGLLRDQGVDVAVGVLADAVRRELQPWLTAVGRGRPYVTWKYAASADGRIAAADGTSRWITGPEARVDVHRERAMVDAVVVGIGTVLADDPQVTVRDWPAQRQPLRVVVDTHARTPVDARVIDATASTLLAVGDVAEPAAVSALEATGATVVQLPTADQRVDLRALLTALYEREVRSVLLEGGARLAAGFVRLGLVDRVVGYLAPVLLGAGPSALADIGVATLSAAPRLRLAEVVRVGADVRITTQVEPEPA